MTKLIGAMKATLVSLAACVLAFTAGPAKADGIGYIYYISASGTVSGETVTVTGSLIFAVGTVGLPNPTFATLTVTGSSTLDGTYFPNGLGLCGPAPGLCVGDRAFLSLPPTVSGLAIDFSTPLGQGTADVPLTHLHSGRSQLWLGVRCRRIAWTLQRMSRAQLY